MSVVTNSEPVLPGQDILAEQYNDLRDDLLAVEQNALKVGSIILWAGNTTIGDLPNGWVVCDGSALSRTEYAVLFALIGTTYGVGDNSTTFNIPDLRDRFPIGASATYPRGTTAGAATANITHTHGVGSHVHPIAAHTHTAPAHTHGIPAHSHNDGSLAAQMSIEHGRVYVNRAGGPYNSSHSASGLAEPISNTHYTDDSINVTGNTGDWSGTTDSGGAAATSGWSGSTEPGGSGTTNPAGNSLLPIIPPALGIVFLIKAT